MTNNKSHVFIQIILVIFAFFGLSGGVIACYVSVLSAIAKTETQLVDVKDKIIDIRQDIARVDRNVNSINEYLRPVKRTDK